MAVNQVYRLILMRLLVRFLMKIMFFMTCILNLQQVNKMVILKMVNKMVILLDLVISLLMNQVILVKHPQVLLHSVLMLHSLPMISFQMNKCNLNLLS
ncbi:hypothetical protein V6N11_044044 [Hibiscus sabdariffa]|uniref:Uncharacterized protein n=1 Tax=Hibiscus sabdariffa TaxID=183260 RepID=A0ABR2RE06_9ROSI